MNDGLGAAMEAAGLRDSTKVAVNEIADLRARVEKIEWLLLQMSGIMARKASDDLKHIATTGGTARQ
jgi:hypothetical protein